MGGAAVLLAVPVLCCRLSHFAPEDVAQHDRVLSWREGQILVVPKIVCVLRTLIYPPYDGDAGAGRPTHHNIHHTVSRKVAPTVHSCTTIAMS